MAGAYLSYPFCAQKCTYCNFASGVFPRSLEDDYLAALVAECEATEWAWKPETVYLGGGTPGSMEPEALAVLLRAVPGGPWTEATLEASPGGVTPDRVRAWREAGINRISLGVQSFMTAEIRRTGRKHTAETVASEIAVLRDAGVENFNIDLIAGLAGQTAASWRESLDWIDRLAPPHVSVYMLEVDEDSRLGREMLSGGLRYGAADAPSGEMAADLYEMAVERLAAMGIRRYEISNFARPGRESAHNLKYWRLEPYLGLGADAHSFDGKLRWSNVESPREYVAKHQTGESPRLPATEACFAEEQFFVGLRLSAGIRPHQRDRERYDQPIRRFLREGLLEADGDVLRLTPRGVLLSNEVFQEFLPA